MRIRIVSILSVILLSPCTGLSEETLILTAPPRETAEVGKKQYEPIAEFISKTINRSVIYEYPANWLSYQSNMRKGKYDIVFDGPHFASWRMAHLGHNMLVSLPGTLQFYLLTSVKNNNINSSDDLIGKKICGISPPNLSSVSIMARYRNPVRQPIIKGVKGGMGKVYKTFLGGSCDAFILRSPFYHKKLDDSQRKALKIIYKTPELPNQVISAGKRLTAEEKAQIKFALLTEEGIKATRPTLDRFAKQAVTFKMAADEEYKDYNEFLEGIIFGW